MKHNNNNLLFFGKSGIANSGNIISSEKGKEPFQLPERFDFGTAGQLNDQPIDFFGLNPGAQIFKQDTALFPAKRTNSDNSAIKTTYNDYLRETAARLSDVEMALDCYNVTDLQFSTNALKELFLEMKMPAVYQLTVQMEELAKEYELEEVKGLLRAIKKIIAQGVKHRN
jgi:hypothetical protein